MSSSRMSAPIKRAGGKTACVDAGRLLPAGVSSAPAVCHQSQAKRASIDSACAMATPPPHRETASRKPIVSSGKSIGRNAASIGATVMAGQRRSKRAGAEIPRKYERRGGLLRDGACRRGAGVATACRENDGDEEPCDCDSRRGSRHRQELAAQSAGFRCPVCASISVRNVVVPIIRNHAWPWRVRARSLSHNFKLCFVLSAGKSAAPNYSTTSWEEADVGRPSITWHRA